jgi:autotransporter-associated beta strand protein
VITRANAGGQENTTITLTGGGVLDMNAYAIGSAAAPIGVGAGSAMNFGSTPVAGFGASSTLLTGTLKNLAEFNGGTTPLLQATSGGTLILTGNNTYSGGTSITAGTILANSPAGSWSTGSGPVNIFSGGLLAGTGHIGGPLAGGGGAVSTAAQVIVNSGSGAPGGTISAGSGATSADSTGLLTAMGGDMGTTTYSVEWIGGSGGSGGTYVWKVNANNSTASTVAQSGGVGTSDPAGPGIGWDMLSMGSLNVAAGSGSQFNVQIVPIGTGASSFNPALSYTWTIADVTSGIVTVNGTTYKGNSAPVLANLQAALQAALALNPSALPAPRNNFSILATPDGASGDDIAISYNPAPEPGALSMLALGAVALMARRRRTS